jgi:hypothetical protein
MYFGFIEISEWTLLHDVKDPKVIAANRKRWEDNDDNFIQDLAPNHVLVWKVEGHHNSYLIDSQNRTLERFEPNGVDNDDTYLQVDRILNELCDKQNLTYIPPSEFCPSVGPQSMQLRAEYSIRQDLNWLSREANVKEDYLGSCSIWSLWYLVNRVQYPDVKPVTLMWRLYNSIQRGDDIPYSLFIKRYTQRVHAIVTRMFDEEVAQWQEENQKTKQPKVE